MISEKEERSKQASQTFNEEVRRSKDENNTKYNGLQIGDMDKKLISQLYLACQRRPKMLRTQ